MYVKLKGQNYILLRVMTMRNIEECLKKLKDMVIPKPAEI